ncbi:hypothetical protein [Haemophilus influenzae]|uniref:hypothetical protein n=1 Tax=Haemophilus influenzae TaxID=727 RepID=UPI003D808F63
MKLKNRFVRALPVLVVLEQICDNEQLNAEELSREDDKCQIVPHGKISFMI